MTHCSVCLSTFRDPVCIPCGHVFCKRCLTDHANAPGNNGFSAKCPECRSTFDLVVPELTYLPEKYHKFVTHNVRRVYVDFSSANKELRESLKAAEDRLARKAATEQALLRRCESLTEALSAHREGERDANLRIMELEDDIANMEKQVNEKVRELRVTVMKLMEKESESKISIRADIASNRSAYLSSSQSADSSPVVLRTKPKHRKYVVQLPRGRRSAPSKAECTIELSTSEDAPIANSMSSAANSSASASTSRAVLDPSPDRPIRPLPRRRKNRIVGGSVMSIDVSDFF